MKEKFRLRCDINNITDIEETDAVTEAIEKYNHIQPYHRYSYLFRGYHDLTHGKIDDEVFFTLGDITSDHELFSHATQAGLETVFMLEDTLAADTLYIVEQAAWEYYHAKVGDVHSKKFMQNVKDHGSALLVI